MGSAISQIPPSVDGVAFPPRPPSVCQFCWERPFAVHLGLFGIRAQDRQKPSDNPMIEGYSYSTSWLDLESRAATGCVWCQFLCALPRDSSGATPDRSGPLEVTVGRPGRPKAVEATPSGTQNLVVLVGGKYRFHGYVYADADDPAATCIVARSPILDVGSPRALRLAKGAIEQCANGHERCIALSASSSSPPLPTRLIDCSDPTHPRLTPTAGGHGRYLALSYVWGEAQPHKTTTSNISTYTRLIDPARLPATIRDAIHVTHALGFRYLWADTLCIIQDSDEDRRREIGRMHDIYRDAYLTIIAASAHKVSEGFLQDRAPPPQTELKPGVLSGDLTLPFICPPRPGPTPSAGHAPTPEVGTIHISPRYVGVEGAIQLYSHTSEPISTRGWCMQEYLMSPRALLFTSATLQLRCLTTTRNVGGSFYHQHGERRMPDALFLPDPAQPEGPDSAKRDAVHKAWLEIVEDYTRRAITVPSDKLVACSAIAASFQRVLRTDFLAGLWRDTLLVDLLWHKRDGVNVPRPEGYRAPSWSWAAVDGAVKTGGRWGDAALEEESAIAEVVRCDVAREDPALPFGQVKGGSLVLRAALIPCVLRPGEESIQCVLQRPDKQARGAETGSSRKGRKKANTNAKDTGRAYLDSITDEGVQQTWAVPILKEGEWARFWTRQGLVVALVNSGDGAAVDPGKAVYRRIGFFYIEEEDSGRRKAPTFNWMKSLPLVEIELV